MDLNFCKHTYGSSPCTASGSSGSECYNTRSTCQDVTNFDRDTPAPDPIEGTVKTYRFANVRLDELQGTGEAPVFPTLLSMEITPTRLERGTGLGIRSSVKVKVMDCPYTDVGIDPYFADRSVKYPDNGSLWGRLISRNRYYEGRVMRIKQGYLNEDGTYSADNVNTRTFLISRIAGADSKGIVTIEGKDPLKKADTEKAQLPAASTAQLAADINNSQTSITIVDDDDIITTEFSAGQPWIRIDDEIMKVTAVSGSSPNYTLTVTRGTNPSIYPKNTEADEHDEDATVQNCYYFDNVRIDNLLYYLLNTVAGIPSSYLPLTDWATVIDNGLQSYSFSALIAEPTGVSTLLKELTEYTVYIWWDERDQEVKLDSLQTRNFNGVTFLDDRDIVKDTVNCTKDIKNRISQIWLYIGLRSPILELDKIQNYQQVRARADLDAETAEQYDQKQVKRIYSRWMTQGLGGVADEINTNLLNQYRDTQTVVTFEADPKDDIIWTGSGVRMQTGQIQDELGQPQQNDYTVIQTTEKLDNNGVKLKYVAAGFQGIEYLRRLGGITPNTMLDYSAESEANRAVYAFISDNNGLMSDGSDAYGVR